MAALGRFDSDLEMFVDEPRTAEYRHLVFYRWLAARGRLEHDPAGPPSGDCCEAPKRRVPLLDYSGEASP